MIAKHEISVTFSDGDFLPSGTPRPSSVLKAFENAASAHSDAVGVGFDDLIKRGLIWVAVKVKYRLTGQILPGVTYRLITYPIPHGSLMYRRDYYIISETGDILIRGVSQWCVADMTTRKAVQADINFPGEPVDTSAIPDGICRIRAEHLNSAGQYTFTTADSDRNGHTNNCRYAGIAADTLGADSVTEFEIMFSKETYAGDTVELYTSPDGIVTGCFPDGGTVFTAKAI